MQCRRSWFDPWVGKVSWRRAWQPTPVSLPGEFHGQRGVKGYSPRGRKELDTTERLTPASPGVTAAIAFDTIFSVLLDSADSVSCG